MSAVAWHLRERTAASGGVVAHDRFGHGPPVVLVHGTPSWSFLWRRVVPLLAGRFTVYLFDLLGYGESEQNERQTLSIAAQARLLSELLQIWDLKQPAIAGHDIGGAIVLRANLIEGRTFAKIALVDSVVYNPWLTPTTVHIKNHLDSYQTMPMHIYEEVVRAHIRTAVARRLDDETLAGYMAPWVGTKGQQAYFRKIAHFDEADTAALEPLLATIATPTLILWGKSDGWINPSIAQRLHSAIQGSRLSLIEGAGHFCTEDAPERVAQELTEFFEA